MNQLHPKPQSKLISIKVKHELNNKVTGTKNELTFKPLAI